MRPLLVALLLAALPACAQAQGSARGQYIVTSVGLCGDCHTPRDAQGALIQSEAMHGAPIGMTPTHPMPWADTAPRIAGLPANWTQAQMVTFLRTGKRPDGSYPLPPMPPYRLSEADAQAVAQYLHALK